MPRNPKVFFHGDVHFVTCSVEQDFMFPPNPLVREVILKSAAQAQALHPVRISDLLVESTHVHLIMEIVDPTDAADFMERFKTETAHAVNRLLGRRKRTVWCEGYDSPLIPDLPTLLDRICYIYENPSKDALTNTVGEYPGFNTFELRLQSALGAGPHSEDASYSTYRIARSSFKKLKNQERLTEHDYRRLRDALVQDQEISTFTVSPHSVLKRFGVNSDEEIRRVNSSIVEEVRCRELKHLRHRQQEGRTVIGARRLVRTPIGANFVPDRKGRRMLVHSINRKLRKQILCSLRALIREGKQVLAAWRLGDTEKRYPLGLFPPTGIRLAEALRR